MTDWGKPDRSFLLKKIEKFVSPILTEADEATPHLHIDFVPYITGSKRGVDTRVSLKQALSALGFKGGTRSDTEWNQWANAEKEQLAQVMERHGIEWEKKGTNEEHLSVLDFKKKERTREVQQLEVQKQLAKNNIDYYENTSFQMREQLTELNSEIKDAEEQKKEVEAAAEKAEKSRIHAQKKADRIQQYVTDYEKDVWEYDYNGKWQLPDAGPFITGKAYREKKAFPLVKKLKNVIRNLTIQLTHAKSEIERLTELLGRKNDKINRLENRIEELKNESDYHQNRSIALSYMEQAIGRTQVEQIILRQMKREEPQQAIQKRQKSHDLSL